MGNLLSKPNTEYKAHHIFGPYNARYNERYIEQNLTVPTKAHYVEILADYEIAQEKYKRCQCKYCTYDMKISTKNALLASIFGSFQ